MTPPSWVAPLAEAIDRANRSDPRIQPGSAGDTQAVSDARRVERWVRRVTARRGADVDAVQELAARAHHLYRWELPRADAGPGRANYLRWRRAAAEHQGRRLGELCAACGVPAEPAQQMCALVAKSPDAPEAWAQDHEDALCLAFLEADLADLVTRLDEAAALRALERTWSKMSQNGRDLADEMLADQPALRDLVSRATTPDR